MNPLNIEPNNLAEKVNKLTPRQMQVVGLLAQGNSAKQVGYILSIGTDTVKKHIYNACDRLEVENKTQLIVMYAMYRMMVELTVEIDEK
jgi:DNA-binding CsgD family transcriptional regulator